MKNGICALLLALILILSVFPLASCSKETTPLYERGEEIVSLMGDMLYDDEYLKMHGYTDDCSEALEALRSGNYSKIFAVYEIEADLNEIRVNGRDFELSNVSEELRTYCIDKAVITFSSTINTKAGLDSVLISTFTNAQSSFVNTEVEESKLYLYVFDDGCPIAVAFVKGEDNTFRATGSFIVNDNFMTDEPESIESSCLECGMREVKVTKIK